MKPRTKKLLLTIGITALCLFVNISLTTCAYKFCPDKTIFANNPVENASWPLKVIIVPMWEEFLFRGTVLFLFLLFVKDMSPKGRKIWALTLIVASGILFGPYHFSNTGPYLLKLITLAIIIQGMLLAWLVIKTRHLVWSMMAHISVNAFLYFFL